MLPPAEGLTEVLVSGTPGSSFMNRAGDGLADFALLIAGEHLSAAGWVL